MAKPPTNIPRLTIKLAPDEKARWLRCAAASFQDLTSFVRQSVSERCDRVERLEKKRLDP